MAFAEAKEQMGQTLRWTPEPKNDQDKSIYLGKVIQGFYKEKKTGVGQNESNIYEIQLATGELVSIWGSGLLDGKFDEIPKGCEVRITYLGVAQPKSPKGRAYQNFTVEYDKDSKIPMMTAGSTLPQAAQLAPSGIVAAPAQAAPVAPAPVQAVPTNDGF